MMFSAVVLQADHRFLPAKTNLVSLQESAWRCTGSEGIQKVRVAQMKYPIQGVYDKFGKCLFREPEAHEKVSVGARGSRFKFPNLSYTPYK